MRPAEFAPEAIIQAGQELQAVGRNITGFALRQKVGGGNPSRLKQVWDEHISSQAVTKAEPVAELPIEVAEEVATVTKALTERLAALAVELNDKAVKAAERRVAEVIRTAGEQREQAERELADASQTVDDLENKLDEAKAEKDELARQLVDVQAAYQVQAVELAQVRERLVLTEKNSQTAAQEHAAELVRLNGSIEAERNRYQQQVEQIRSDLGEQKKIAQEATAERDQVRAELAMVKARAEVVAQEVHRITEQMTKAEADRDTARKEARSACEDVASLRGQVATLQAQASDLLRALAARQNVDGADDTVSPGAKPTNRAKKAE